jgi:GT2 family glycosyltransferase
MPGALLARREVFERIGDFDTNYQLAPDVDWFARAKDAGLHFEPLPMLVINKAVHADNLSHSDFDLYSREIVRALRDSAARQGSR